jgi:hypothetical protein
MKLLTAITLGIFLLVTISARAEWDNGRLSSPIVIDGRIISYPIFAIFLMPEQKFDVHYQDAVQGGRLEFGDVSTAIGESRLQAPAQPGLQTLRITSSDGSEQVLINVFTLTPATAITADFHLNGYRIGQYPREPLRGNDIYLPPKGFVEVTADNADTRLSPNFTLGQFVAKQNQGYPKYVVLRASLLMKLENILATLNRQGHPTDSLYIMSGYRTPWYNRQIGNVPYSRHVWGGAADFFIDESPRDGRMDDLNGDGVVNRADARWLADFINAMSQRGEFGNRIGGLGVYGSNAAHGPFVHVDVRGSRARW